MTDLMYFLQQEFGGEVILITQGNSTIDFATGAQSMSVVEQSVRAVLLPESTSLFRPAVPQAATTAAPLGLREATRIILIDKDSLAQDQKISLFSFVQIGDNRYSIVQPIDLPFENAFQLMLTLDKGGSAL